MRLFRVCLGLVLLSAAVGAAAGANHYYHQGNMLGMMLLIYGIIALYFFARIALEVVPRFTPVLSTLTGFALLCIAYGVPFEAAGPAGFSAQSIIGSAGSILSFIGFCGCIGSFLTVKTEVTS